MPAHCLTVHEVKGRSNAQTYNLTGTPSARQKDVVWAMGSQITMSLFTRCFALMQVLNPPGQSARYYSCDGLLL